MILAGDIGGTKSLLSLFEMKAGALSELKSKKYVSSEYENLDSLVMDFLKDTDVVPKWVVFGIPGSVGNWKIQLTNLPWIIDADELKINQ